MTYFIDPYKKYYEVLNQASNLPTNANLVSEKINEVKTKITNVDTYISNSSWKELGINELSDNVLPNLIKNIETLYSNTEILSKIASKSIKEFLPELKKLKETDEQYDAVRNQISQLVSVPRYNSDGSSNPYYQTYINNKTRLENSRNELRTKCEEYTRNCNTIYNSIKSLNSGVEEFKEKITNRNGRITSESSIIESVEGGKMLRITYDGKEYYVVNTKINCLDYENYVLKNGLNQNSGLLGAECMLLSQYYAMDMMRGTWTSKSDMENRSGSPATRISDYTKSTNEDDILQYIYEEALAGRPTVLQVTQINSDQGGRHLVTVVGFDSSVKSYEDLTPDKIFVLDCVDGKLQTLGKARSEGGHERDLFKQGGTYFARGASSSFLNLEVNNSEWQANNGKGNKSTTA